MKKEEFLEKLKMELKGLESKDIEDILRDQEEFVRDAMSAGRSEEEVIKSLGSPKSFADSVKLEYKVKKIHDAPNTWESYKEVLGSGGVLLALAPLNFIILFGPVVAILGFLFSWIVTSGVIVCVGAALMLGQLFASFFGVFTFTQMATTLFGCIGITALGMCGVAIFILMSELFIKVFISYAKWNISLVKGRSL